MGAYGHLANHRAFDLLTAVQLADAATAVYESGEVIEQMTREQLHATRFRFVDERNVEAFLAGTDEWSLLCFRGTEADCMRDWLTDLNSSLVPGPLAGRVHLGFYEALSHVWREIEETLEDWEGGSPKPLWITGHSLGGALAVLAAARWLHEGRYPQGVYTYGQPRCGDSAFSRNFNFLFKTQCFRVVNNRDLVTRIPPRSLGYSHLGTFKYITADGYLENDIAWWNEFLSSWSTAYRDFLGWAWDGVDDHRMVHYRRLLASLFDATPEPVRQWGALRSSLRHIQPPASLSAAARMGFQLLRKAA